MGIQVGSLGGRSDGWYLNGIKEAPLDAPESREYEARLPTKLSEICLYYANIIDYARVVLNLFAGVAIWADAPWSAGFFIIGSQLLDWIDGPVARAYNQVSER